MSTLVESAGSLIYLVSYFKVQFYLRFMATNSIAGASLLNIIRCFREKFDLDLFLSAPWCWCGTSRYDISACMSDMFHPAAQHTVSSRKRKSSAFLQKYFLL